MNTQIDRKRIFIYIGFAFGIAWITSLIIYLRGGLVNSRELVPNTGITEALVLLAGVVMFAPTFAHILTRLITREGWQNVWLRPHFKQGWKYWLVVWFGTAILIYLGAAIYFLFFPQHFDAGFSQVEQMLNEMEAQTGQAVPFSPLAFIVIQLFSAALISPLVNLIPIFGEEFGWRVYLQPKLLPLGEHKAMIWMGIIWGVWHWPVLAMGHNYGFDYPGAPWTAFLAFTWFTFTAGTFFGWATLRAGSVWPAVIGHAIINGLAGGVLFMTQGEPNPLLGPSIVGVVGGVGFAIVALWLFFGKGLKKTSETTSMPGEPSPGLEP